MKRTRLLQAAAYMEGLPVEDRLDEVLSDGVVTEVINSRQGPAEMYSCT